MFWGVKFGWSGTAALDCVIHATGGSVALCAAVARALPPLRLSVHCVGWIRMQLNGRSPRRCAFLSGVSQRRPSWMSPSRYPQRRRPGLHRINTPYSSHCLLVSLSMPGDSRTLITLVSGCLPLPLFGRRRSSAPCRPHQQPRGCRTGQSILLRDLPRRRKVCDKGQRV